jgi:hypothetical protein
VRTPRALLLLVFEPLLDQRPEDIDRAFRRRERAVLRGAKFIKPGAPARLTLVLKVDDGHDFPLPLAPGWRFSLCMATYANEGV